ncbi:type II toxin-antitoxin system VapC family toxin [Halalkalicoccus sp. NIPERK01]|uniref:type II toxin-antitoxin system VapC family toxin n=1 Tax=Halalkalicoccus sp. NIPERK01 TaxID=3053469 RepID=UPI00256EE2E1|nr:type II toxin-antitoxin system VapC family toxin [Halalkalicoccus sp. NIPERK01]MDL5360854.1 type II toxin-antitoxin system VapC family toxin [Halalkalicoccus sp. NIPERK01]
MGGNDDPVLFDVGVIALAHAGTPVSEPALEHVREAIHGDLDAIVPYAAVIGAHHVLRGVYRIPRETATKLLANFLDARRIHWHRTLSESEIRSALAVAGETNIDGWDGYYATVAREAGVSKVLTLDSDFDRPNGIDAEVILSRSEFAELDRFIDELSG